jgi:hypothetical protein
VGHRGNVGNCSDVGDKHRVGRGRNVGDFDRDVRAIRITERDAILFWYIIGKYFNNWPYTGSPLRFWCYVAGHK